MDKKKKIILISVIVIVVLIIIGGGIWYFISKNSNNNETVNESAENSKLSKLYQELNSKNSFSFETILDDNNKMFYAKSGNTAYTDTNYNGNKTKYVIKDGNSYLLVDSSKTYYTYKNNMVNLNKVQEAFDELINGEGYETGKEEINGENYNYEQYVGKTNLTLQSFDDDTNNVKTRLYFKGNDLVYIKTISEETEELLKVNISYEVDPNLFEIPEDYKEA